MKRSLVLLSGVFVACVLSATAGAHKTQQLQHVTIFGDSEAAALAWDAQARVPIEKANKVLYELHPCGRLSTPGCISPPPPSVLARVRALGTKLGPTVIVLVGYNDDPHVYLHGIDTVLHAMHRRGVKQVLWLTLRTVAHPGQYKGTNSVIRGAARRFPWMTVVNWGGYSAPHPEWFVSDGIHFNGSGAVQFGNYLHRTLKHYGLTGPVGGGSG